MERGRDEEWVRVERGRAVREIAQSRLTPTQYRRVARIYGFDAPPESLREIADAEGVHWTSVHESHTSALATLRTDGRLLLLWLSIYV